VDPFPTTAIAGPDQTICSSTATLAGNAPTTGSGTWSVIAGSAAVTTPSSPTSGVTGLSVGQNIFVWTIQNGTCPSSRDTVTIDRDATPTTASAGTDQTLCSSTSTLSGNTPTIGTGVWSLVSGNGTPTSPSLPNSPVTGLTVGTNVFQWTITNGTCPSSTDQVNIIVDPFPTTANAGPDQTVCSSTATLAGNTPTTGSGTWSVIAGGATVTTPSSPTSGVTGLSVGQNVFVWTTQNGTCPSSRDTVTIDRDAMPSAASAGAGQTLCSPSTSLNAVNPSIGTGLWTLISGSGTFTNPTADNTTVNGMSVGPNVFQWTVTNGVCPASTDQVTVTVDAMPTTAAAGNDQTICSSTATLGGNTPVTGSGTWSVIAGGGNVGAPSSPTSGVSNLSTGQNMLVWTIDNGTCPSSHDTVEIQRDAAPSTAVAGADQTLCSSSAILNATNPSTGTGTWTLISGGGTFSNPTSDNTGVNGMSVGPNIFEWTVTNGVCPASTDQVTVNVDAMPTPASAGTDQSICTSTYTLNGNTPSIGSGAWTVLNGSATVTSPSVPNSGATNLLTGQNVFSWTITNGTCPASRDTVIIDVDAAPSAASAGSDQTLCSPSAFLNANNPQTGSGVWSLVSGNGVIANPNSDITSISNLTPGANIFQWIISNGVCPSSMDSVTITVDEMPTAADAGTDDILCTSSHQLNGNTPLVGTGTWSVVQGGGTFTNANLPTTSVTSLPFGLNILQWTISNGVCPSSSDNVLLTIDLFPTQALAGADHARCSFDDTLTGNTPLIGTGVWALLSGSGIIQNPSSVSSPVSGLGVGVNEFTWTISNGVCPSSVDTIVITRDDFPSQAVAGADANSCAPTDTLPGTLPQSGAGTWSVIGGNSVLNDPLAANSAVSSLTPGQNIFVWTVSNGVCPVTQDTMIITYNEFPSVPNAGADIFACSEPVTMQAQVPVIGTGVWAPVQGGPLVSDSMNPQMQLPVLAPGTWQYIWTTQNGFCIAAPDTVAITVYALPDTAIAGDDRITYVRSLQLNATPLDTGIGTWTFVQGSGTFEDIHDPDTRVADLAPGVNIVRWTASNGTCEENSDDLRIQVMELIVPQGFSPNGDGVNDQFEITGLHEFESPSLVVFNRWGNQVFTSDAYANNWNGTGLNGEQLPDDAYYYVLKVDNETVFTGYIMIKRSTP
jgi:gliding motility-associated-like protein